MNSTEKLNTSAVMADEAKVIAEDDDGLEGEEEEHASEIEVPFDPTKIDIIVKPMSIGSLEDRLDNSELDLTPDFQRQANLWDIKRKSRLIESILLRIPLPSFYFSENLDGVYAVVDGLQRLCTIFHFKNEVLLNKVTGTALASFKLEGLEYIRELEGLTFKDLDRKFQRRIAELEITANIIRANTPAAVKFNVFARLNQGGMPLKAQEIRNAIFPGEWRNQLQRLAKNNKFIEATDHRVRTNRQQDMELVLRYVALWLLNEPYSRLANQTLDEFLNDTVEKKLFHWNSNEWKQAERAFYHAIDAVLRVRGDHAFRKSVSGRHKSPINRGLFEAELIVFGSLDEDTLARAETQKSKIEELFLNELNGNTTFSRSLLYGTGYSEKSNARIKGWKNIITEAVHA
ncbi:hypothetical protein AGMMS49543_15870 [Betaproteobacteria bacterium]|nr:hypothetical protein AGMMS49543_15870 [Betaproteobacteria bacterium]GHU19308.1 hypothetical protein AGMMS50243_11020 [Betaproteobacteria bacterium]